MNLKRSKNNGGSKDFLKGRVWGGETCDLCSVNSYVAWQVNTALWQRVAGEYADCVICLNCFFGLAYVANIPVDNHDFDILLSIVGFSSS
jgi:hypothetical protein